MTYVSDRESARRRRHAPSIDSSAGSSDRNGLEILSRDESLEILRHTAVARIGVTLNALPVVLPVNIALFERVDAEPLVVIRSVEGTKLEAAMRDSVVAIEADHMDLLSHSGWSVLVQGRSTVIREEDQDEALRLVRLRPWAGASNANLLILVTTEVVSGRRIVPWQSPLNGHVG